MFQARRDLWGLLVFGLLVVPMIWKTNAEKALRRNEAFQRLQAELECLRSQHRAKRQSFIDTGCAAPWKVKHSSPDSDGRTARSDPHILVPPESSVTVVAMSGEFA